jgi:hypothetical protein
VRLRRAVGGVDHEDMRAEVGEGQAQALQQHAGAVHLAVGRHRHDLLARRGEQPAQPVGLVTALERRENTVIDCSNRFCRQK